MSAGKYAGRIQASYDEGTRAGVSSTPTLLVGGRLYQGRLRLRRHHPAGRFARAAHRRQMIYRMGAALMSLLGLFVSAYLYLYKIGRIGTLACGTRRAARRCRPAQWSRFLGVEVALIGVVGYAGLLLVALVALQPATRSDVARRRCSRRSPAGGVLFTHLSHLPRAVRHPRHLPLVRRLGGDHRDDPYPGAARAQRPGAAARGRRNA